MSQNIEKKTFHIVSLGCDKNNVDADSMSQLLKAAGYKPVSNPTSAEIVIVNTCGFIDSAKEESYQALEELAAGKKSGQRIIAAGCLTQRYGEEIAQRVPRVDGILGTRRWMDIVDEVERASQSLPAESRFKLSKARTVGTDEHGTQRISVQGASAYIKIADGCSRACAFCAIPLIKGPTVSRPTEAILNEARSLQEMGIREIVLIAQNTTDYGRDLGMKNRLAHLLKEMTAAVPKIDWIRIMYAFPGFVSDELIEVMATHKQITPYLDMPLQHAHSAVLKRMGRPANMDWVYKTLEKMRKDIPGIALRTTFIVGYPGETEKEFKALLDFIDEIRFDKLGALKYSHEAGTPAEIFGDTVPDEVKEERLRLLMGKQQQISLEINRSFMGKELDVLIEGKGQGISIGRSYRDAPKVDGLVLVEGDLPIGKMATVQISNAMVYDLSGTVEARRR